MHSGPTAAHGRSRTGRAAPAAEAITPAVLPTSRRLLADSKSHRIGSLAEPEGLILKRSAGPHLTGRAE